MIQSGKFADKNILIIDKDPKKDNDRTWCFWEKQPSLFQSIVYKEWSQLQFHSAKFSKLLDINPYVYKLIRGIDLIGQQKNISFRQGGIESISSDENETYVIAGDEKFTASYIFNSILFENPVLKDNQYWLLQHFTGWVIEANESIFDPAVATLMDFRTNQSEGTTFFYVLPFSTTKALIEYTVFSKHVLAAEQYEKALRGYIQHFLKTDNYKIVEREFGVIPMTNFSFLPNQNKIINIGTAGGYTKGSSGYTFRFIQKNAMAIVRGLKEKNDPLAFVQPQKRFQFYDSVLLNILNGNKMDGDIIFTQLFQKNKASNVLAFLDNESSLAEDLTIISSLPTGIFLKAAIEHIGKGF